MTCTRILIADDHQMFSEGLIGLLEGSFEIVGTVGDGQSLIDEAVRLRPDVVIVDIAMPVLNGLDAARKISSDLPDSKIVFLTMHADRRLVTEAFRAGGAAYVLKQSAGEELIQAIEQVTSGHRYISPTLASVDEFGDSFDSDKKHHRELTRRQREVLQLISEGMTMKEIAQELGISTRTAESYKYEMMTELGVSTTAELIQYAIKLGLSQG